MIYQTIVYSLILSMLIVIFIIYLVIDNKSYYRLIKMLNEVIDSMQQTAKEQSRRLSEQALEIEELKHAAKRSVKEEVS